VGGKRTEGKVREERRVLIRAKQGERKKDEKGKEAKKSDE
jgi:hypothetical protein